MPSSSVAQLYLFLHVSRPELQNNDFAIPYHRLLPYLQFDCLKENSNLTQASYEKFHLLARSCVRRPQVWHNHSIVFISLALSFKIMVSQCHIIDCFVSFHSHVWTQKLRYHTSHLWTFSFTHALLSTPSSSVPQLCLFLHVSWHEFQNRDFSMPYHRLLH